MNIIKSKDLWENIESQLNSVINDKEVDFVLRHKAELLINKYNGNVANDNVEAIIPDVKVITSTLSQEHYYKNRRLDKEEVKKMTKLCEDLSLFEKILVQEYRVKLKELSSNKKEDKTERLPNVDSDKSMKLFK